MAERDSSIRAVERAIALLRALNQMPVVGKLVDWQQLDRGNTQFLEIVDYGRAG